MRWLLAAANLHQYTGRHHLVGRFSADWRVATEAFLDGSTGAAVDSVKNIRDNIAHGINHGITLGSVTQYRDEIVNTIDFLERLFETG